jgi:hypothetical protein
MYIMHGKHIKQRPLRVRPPRTEQGGAHFKSIGYGSLALPLIVGIFGTVGAIHEKDEAKTAPTAYLRAEHLHEEWRYIRLQLGLVATAVGFGFIYAANKTSATGSGYTVSFPEQTVVPTEVDPEFVAESPDAL